MLLTLFERYSQLLQRTFSADFEKVRPLSPRRRFLPPSTRACPNEELTVVRIQIVIDDDHQPMVVNDPDEFDKVVSVTWLPPDGDWSVEGLKACAYPLP